MRYFYHVRWGFDTYKERPSTLLMEIDKETYEAMVIREKEVLERNPKWKHFKEPIQSEDVPEGKSILYF